MTLHYRTTVTAIGPEVAELAEGGILILYADGAPPELAEVSVLHRVTEGPSVAAPLAGASLRIGGLSVPLTAIGERAWAKIADMGHVVVNFNGAAATERPGELCARQVPAADLMAALVPGAMIEIA